MYVYIYVYMYLYIYAHNIVYKHTYCTHIYIYDTPTHTYIYNVHIHMYIYIYHIYIYVRHSEAFDVRSPAPTFSMGSQRDVAFSSASNPRYPKIQQDSPWKSL